MALYSGTRVLKTGADAARGLAYIEEQLTKGKPVIVSVDYRIGCSMGDTRNDKAGDHFVIIVGGNINQGFHYFDPATEYPDRGTSAENLFKYENGLLINKKTCMINKNTKSPETYIVSGVRINL
ncbi:MAG: hypothetical protein NC113_05470 [Bacteroides sp.]|nr:hypothetical protein [Bacteroides sp.]MCM1447657.1 hypothetical protein [Bacteroides sp.]